MRFLKALRQRSLMVRAGLIVLIFVGFSIFWITVTDQILGWLVRDPDRMMRLATYKGSLYICIMALLLFWQIVSVQEAVREERTGEGGQGLGGPEDSAEVQSLWAPLALFAGVALVALGLGVVIYQRQRDLVEKQALAELSDRTRLQVERFEAWFLERWGDTLTTSKDPLLQEELQHLIQEPSPAAGTRALLDVRLKVLLEAYPYDSAKIVDALGNVVASSGDSVLDPVERQGLAQISPVNPLVLAWRVPSGKEPGPGVKLSYCASILDGKGAKTLGVVVLRFSLDTLLARTFTQLPTYHSTLETLLVCQQGEDLVYLTPTRLGEKPLTRMPMARVELVGVQALRGGDGTFQGVDYRGVASVAVARKLTSLPWVLLSKLDMGELSLPLQRLTLIYGGASLLFLALAGVTLFTWRTRETARIQAERRRRQAENQLLEYRLEFLSQHGNDILLLVEPTGHIRYANDRAVEAYGYDLNELLDRSLQDLRAPETLGEFPAQMAELQERGTLRFETIHCRKDGSRFPVEVSARSLVLENVPCFQSIIRDITERKRAEEALRESGERYRRLFDEVVEGIALMDLEGNAVVDCNQAFLRLTGLERGEVIGASLAKFHAPHYLKALRAHIQLVLNGETSEETLGTCLLTGSGTEKDVEIKVSRIELHGKWLALGFFRDITEELQREFERETTLSLLRLLNEPIDTHALLGNITRFIQEWSGCEAVGIRLRENEDFPYFETRGFPDEFIEQENQLCVRDLAGQLLREGSGTPVLECMCGNILCGRFNPALPFFTANGSFWCNGTTEWLASTSEQDRQAMTHNRCNDAGYESVALIPLRHGDQVLGLLQLNDHAKGCFSLERIAFLESVGSQIALALANRQAQAALAYSERRFRDLSEAAGEFLWETGADGTFTFLSERITDILEYTPEELKGHNPLEFMVFSETERIGALTGDDRNFRNREVPLISKSGRVVWARLTRVMKFDEQGEAVGSLGAGLDITEQKLSEQDLRESERKLAALIGNLPGFVYRGVPGDPGDGNWIMEYISEGCRGITGHGSNAFTTDRTVVYAKLIPPEHRTAIQAKWRQVLQDQSMFEAEYPILTATGETRWVWERGNGSFDQAGRPLFMEGFVTDITERKAAEAKILRMAEELEQRVRERTAQLEAANFELEAFSYSVSHDLRAPLRGIDGFSQILLEDYRGKLDETGKHYLERIRNGTQRMGLLIDDLLKLSRVSRIELDRMAVDLSHLCGKVLDDLAFADPARRVGISIQPGLTVQADRRLLLVALENLLGNAWKFTSKRAEARIEVGELSSHGGADIGLYAKLHANVHEGERVFFIRDNGAGFDMTYVDKLFKAFQRLHVDNDFEGTGIGLAIVQRIFRRHGGRVWAEAEVNHGATFFFTLPDRGVL